MSIPTYIRRRRIADPVEYVSQGLLQEGEPVDMALLNRIFQLHNYWKGQHAGYDINDAKRITRPFWLVPSREDEILISLAAGATLRDVEFAVDTKGHFEIVTALFRAEDTNGDVIANPDFTVQIRDANIPRDLQNDEVPGSAIAGDAKRWLIWPETYFLNTQDAGRSLFVTFRNRSSSQINLRWCFHGRRWFHKEATPEVQRQIERRFRVQEKTYTYFQTLQKLQGAADPSITLTPGQKLAENSAPFFFTDDSSDLEGHKLTIRARNTDGTAPDFLFQLREARSGRTLMTNQVHGNLGWGDGQFPFILPETFLLERNYSLLFEVQNLSTTKTLNLWPVIVGRRLQYA